MNPRNYQVVYSIEELHIYVVSANSELQASDMAEMRREKGERADSIEQTNRDPDVIDIICMED